MYLNVILILVLWTIVSFGERLPTISYITQEQIKDIGGTIVLECSVQQFGKEYSVHWTKKESDTDITFFSTGSTLVIKDSRFSIKYNVSSSIYTLQIEDIQETDAGTYQCRINLSVVDYITADVDLAVRRPPIISDNSTQSIVASEGDSVQMECYAAGYPTPTIIWRRENYDILPTGGNSSTYSGNVLKITSVTKEDRGTYYCVADNGVSKGDKRNVNLQVEFSPIITVSRPRLGQALQYDMDLECHIEAYPLPSISWVKDEISLSNNQHYSVSHFATADEFTDSTLRVITIEKRQYGDYYCRAVNKLGSAEGKVHLFETVIPTCPPACGQGYTGGVQYASESAIVILVSSFIFLFRF